MASTTRYMEQYRTGCFGGAEFYEARTLTGNLDLSATGAAFSLPSVAKLDPGGAHRDVTLELESAVPGLYRRIINGADAAENLVIKDDDGTIATINQNEQGEFWCSPTSGWILICVTTIALS